MGGDEEEATKMMTVMIKEEKSPVLSRKNNFDLSLSRECHLEARDF